MLHKKKTFVNEKIEDVDMDGLRSIWVGAIADGLICCSQTNPRFKEFLVVAYSI